MTQPTLQAIRIHQYGGPEQLVLKEIPRPEPHAGEVFVRVCAAGVLPADWKLRQGYMRGYIPLQFPYTPGTALAGVVEEVGPGVTMFQKGQAVFGRTPYGSYAEYTIAPAESLAHKPKELSFVEAATLSGGATTAWQALFERGALQAGERVLIHGAAGGVGLFAVQFARWKGAQVIATTSTANVGFVGTLGAETVLDYTTTPFEQVARDVDLVLDTIGGETLERSWGALKPGGRLVGLATHPSAEKAQALGILATFGSGLPSSELLATIARLIAEGQITVTVGPIFPLQEARQAHELSQRGHGRGRIVLCVGEQ